PDCRQMAFAGALRSNQRNGARRPVGPPVDQGERGFVGASGEKIRTIEALPMTERKIELARQSRIAHGDSLPGFPTSRPRRGQVRVGGLHRRAPSNESAKCPVTTMKSLQALICSTHSRT